MKSLARSALQIWSDTTGLLFVETTASAQLNFTSSSRFLGPEAYTSSRLANGFVYNSTVNIDQEWLNGDGQSISYTQQTYIHEIGHALGLGHAGNYNDAARYGRDNGAINDSRQLSIMSYFDQATNSYINGTYAFALTPMRADLLAIALGTVIENLSAGQGHDHLIGNDGANHIDGGAGHDTITGGNGNDWLLGGAGSNHIYGGNGVDMVSFTDHAQRVEMDLTTGLARSGAETSYIYDIEGVTGSIYSDWIRGDEGHNRLRSGGHYDWMVGSDGNDSYDGGNGRDTLACTSAPSGVTASLATKRGTGGQAAGDRYVLIESLSGSSYADHLSGNEEGNYLRGGAGDDSLFSNGGRDTIDGGANNDMINGGNGNDRLIGWRGHDQLFGGEGWDTAVYSGRKAEYSVSTLANGTTQILHLNGGIDGRDQVFGVEVLELSNGRISL